MLKSEFKTKIDKLIQLRKKEDFIYSSYTCVDVEEILGRIVYEDYRKFIGSFLCRAFLRREYLIDKEAIRVNLLIGFRDEVLSTKRYLKY
jgi:hypothetical protein